MKPFRTLSAAHDNFLRYRIHREIVLGETQFFIINILQNFFFCENIFQFSRMTFFVRPLRYANFHREYYPSCVSSCNDSTRLPAFLSTESFVLSSKLNPLSLLKLEKKWFFLVNIFVRHTFSVSKSSIKQRQFWQWPIWQNLLSFKLFKDKRMVIKLL